MMMASTQDMVPVKNISLYIPRLAHDSHKDSNFTALDQFIAYKFKSLAIGVVKNIDFKKGFINKEGRVYYKAFIHFENWYDNPTTRSLQHRIFNPKDYGNSCAKLVYEDPHYWMLLENKNQNKKQEAFELVKKLEKQLAQVAQLAEMFQLAQMTNHSKPIDPAQPGAKRTRMTAYGY